MNKARASSGEVNKCHGDISTLEALWILQTFEFHLPPWHVDLLF